MNKKEIETLEGEKKKLENLEIKNKDINSIEEFREIIEEKNQKTKELPFIDYSFNFELHIRILDFKSFITQCKINGKFILILSTISFHFEKVRFKKLVSFSEDSQIGDKLGGFSFNDCHFDDFIQIYGWRSKKIQFIKCIFERRFLFTSNSTKLKSCIIDKCIFKKELEINGVFQNENFSITNSEFYSKLIVENLHNQAYIKIENCLFKENIFFEYCPSIKYLSLKQSIFKKHIFFKEVKIKGELSLERVTFDKPLNLLGVTGLEKIEHTSRETYRIIKHDFQQLNNYIEAAKYHKLELEKYKEELKDKLKNRKIDKFPEIWRYIKPRFGIKQFEDKREKTLKEKLSLKNLKEIFNLIGEYIIFFFNWHSSRFATSWVRPLVWILVVGFLTSLGMNYRTSISFFSQLKTLFPFESQHFFIYFYPFSTLKQFATNSKDSCQVFIFILNKIFLGYLTYQFVTAVRRWTKFG